MIYYFEGFKDTVLIGKQSSVRWAVPSESLEKIQSPKKGDQEPDVVHPWLELGPQQASDWPSSSSTFAGSYDKSDSESEICV